MSNNTEQELHCPSSFCHGFCLAGIILIAGVAVCQEALFLATGKSATLYLGETTKIVIEESAHQPHLILLGLVFLPLLALKALDCLISSR